MGQHPALQQVQGILWPGERIFAFLDDVYLVTTPDRARFLFNAVRDALQAHCGISVNMGKTRVWNRGGQEPLGIRELGSAADRVWVGGADTPPEAQGLVVLGAPIGHGAFVAQHLEAILEEHRRLLARIPHVGDLQSSWLLLSMCANPRANFFLRALAPEDTAAFAAAHDDNLANALADLLELPQEAVAEGTSARQRCQLPLCMGGLGLRSASRTAPAAWWASWADCAQMLRERCPELTNQICAALSELDRGPLPAAPGCLQQASRAKEHLSAHGFAAPNWHDLAQGARPPPTHEREHGEWAHGWQFWAARVLENTARQQLLNASTPPDRALLRSQSGPCAGRTFTALPTTGGGLPHPAGRIQSPAPQALAI